MQLSLAVMVFTSVFLYMPASQLGTPILQVRILAVASYHGLTPHQHAHTNDCMEIGNNLRSSRPGAARMKSGVCTDAIWWLPWSLRTPAVDALPFLLQAYLQEFAWSQAELPVKRQARTQHLLEASAGDTFLPGS